MRLILVHGRAQERKDPEALKGEWLAALARGLAKLGLVLPPNLEVKFPYYGDKLAGLISQIEAEEFQYYALRGEQPESEEIAFRASILAEMAATKGLTSEQITTGFRGQPMERGVANWGWVQAIARAVDAAHFAGGGIELFTRDVYVYLTKRAVRQVVDDIVGDSFTDGPCVVVGHSLGSVVAYNVLRSLKTATSVSCYITVGSPLAINAIKDQLVTPITMPANTRAWFNARDPRDVVALHPLTPATFHVTPAIENIDSVSNGTSNRHGIDGYLDDQLVAGRIYRALTGAP